MKTNAIRKAIEKEVEAQRRRAPLHPAGVVPIEQELARAMRLREARVREEAAREVERAALRAEEGKQEAALAVTPQVVEEVVAALARTKERLVLADEQAARAWEFQHIIVPYLKAAGFEERFCREIVDWGCEAQEAVFVACRALCQGVGAVIPMVGERGTGKTTICAQLAVRMEWWNYLTARDLPKGTPFTRKRCLYQKLSDLIGTFKALYADHGTRDPELLVRARAAVCRADLLIIDEVHECDALTVKNWLLTDFIDRRYAAKRDTILISNQKVDTFRKSTWDSVVSRCQEHGEYMVCEWESWRGKG